MHQRGKKSIPTTSFRLPPPPSPAASSIPSPSTPAPAFSFAIAHPAASPSADVASPIPSAAFASMATAAAPWVCNRRSAPCNRRLAPYVGTADRGAPGGLNLPQYKTPRAHEDPPFPSSRLRSPLSNPATGPAATPSPTAKSLTPTPPAPDTPPSSAEELVLHRTSFSSFRCIIGRRKWRRWFWRGQRRRRWRVVRLHWNSQVPLARNKSLDTPQSTVCSSFLYNFMAPTNLINKRTYVDLTETPRTPRFKDFDDIEYDDTHSNWSIFVSVEVKFLPNKYGDNICFVLMDKTGAKIEASVWGSAEVARFNRILQPGCKYTIHRVIISPNMEYVEFRAIEHLFECHFDQKTVVEPSLPIEFPILPKHLMPFSDVAKRPNKTFVDIVGIVVHCCERECFGRYGKYREAIFMDAWGNLIAVRIWGLQLTHNSYLWSTAEGGNPIVIATMLEKDIKFGDLNSSDYTNVAFNPAHCATRPLQDIRQKIINRAIDMAFVRRFVERRCAFVAMVLAKRDARYKK